MLVSPSKVKPSIPEQRKRASCQDSLGTVKNDLRKVNIYIWGKKIISSGSDYFSHMNEWMIGLDFRRFCVSYMERVL